MTDRYKLLLVHRLFELLFPIWLVFVNGCIAFTFAKILNVKEYRVAGILLTGGAASFVLVNASYILINWSDVQFIKSIVRAAGVAILIVGIVFAIIGSLLTLLGTIVLVRRLLSVVKASSS